MVPLAALLASAAERGRGIGNAMSGVVLPLYAPRCDRRLASHASTETSEHCRDRRSSLRDRAA
jgi:hypothetical protein